MSKKMKQLLLAFLVCFMIGALMAWVGAYFASSRDGQEVYADTESILDQVGTALSQYKMDCGSFPPEAGWTQKLLEKGECATWKGPYLTRSPQDAWRRELVYKSNGRHAAVLSYGADGVEGGEGLNADIKVEID